MLLYPNTAIVVGSLQIEVHQLFYQRLSFCSNAFVEKQLSFHLSHSTTFYGCTMSNDRIQVELFVVYLIGYAQLLMAFEQF